MTFGEKLEYIRKEVLRFTQAELAEDLGISQTTIAALEKGRNKNPSFELYKDMVLKYHINPMYLLTDDPKEPVVLKYTKGIYLPLINKVAKYERLIDEFEKVRNGK